MLMHLPPKERFGYAVLGAVVLFGMGVVGARAARQPAPVVITDKQAPSSVSASGPSVVVVHVAGAVKNPGVYRLPVGMRLDDAIRLAGGATPDASLDEINLAAKLVDGTQVYVPHQEKAGPQRPGKGPATSSHSRRLPQMEIRPLQPEVPPQYWAAAQPDAGAGSKEPSADRSAGTSSSKKVPHAVSLNSATSTELQSLPGIGPATAAKILEYRSTHGPFRSVDEVLAVPGIGPKRMETLRPYLRL
jgi:competence protein ComEA